MRMIISTILLALLFSSAILLGLLKALISHRPEIHLVLMSATLNTPKYRKISYYCSIFYYDAVICTCQKCNIIHHAL